MGNDANVSKRDGFRSRGGFIIACIGSAVGMGNIWRFPTLVSKWGGMTFLLPYFLFVILIGSTGVIGEFALGRAAGAGPVDAFGMCTEARWGKRRPGELVGYIPVLGSLALAIGYTCVMGWIFKYTFLAFDGGLSAMGQDMDGIVGSFNATASAWGANVWVVVAVAVSFVIMSFGIAGGIFQKDPLGRSAKGALGSRIGLWAIAKMRAPVTKALRDSSRFEPPADIYELAEYASEILSLCNSMGEGWLLTAEMVELIKTGAPNVVCTQPFACLPNHVVGKAVIKELRRRYPESNIVAVDYDPGASEVNQLNRIKLMISVAKANLADKEAEAKKARDRFVDAGRPQAVQEEAGALEIETERA